MQPDRTENHLPRAQDEVVSTNENSPVKISLKVKDPDDGKLRFSIENEPSHGRIVEFSSSFGTSVYLHDENYDGKDSFKFQVNDGTADSKDGKISIQVKPGKDLVQGEQRPDQNQQQQQQQEQEQQPNQPQAQQDSTGDSNTGDKAEETDKEQQSSTSDEDKGDQSQDKQQQDEPKEEQQPDPPQEDEGNENNPPNNDS